MPIYFCVTLLMRRPLVIAGLALLGACERGPALRQPVGETHRVETRLTAAVLPSRGDAAGAPATDQTPPESCAGVRLRIEFEFDSALVDRAANGDLERLARCLITRPFAAATILLVGHTDPRGPSSYNLALGLDRAERVKDRLVRYGVAAGRITTATSGEEARSARQDGGPSRRVDVWLSRESSGSAPPSDSAPPSPSASPPSASPPSASSE